MTEILQPTQSHGSDDTQDKLSSVHALNTALLTVREACKALRISKQSLYSKFIWPQKLKTVRIGRRRLIRAAAIHSLIDRLEDGELA